MARAVIGTASVDAAAAPYVVWSLLVDLSRRREWDHDVSWAVVDDWLAPGRYVTIKPKRGRQTAFRIAGVEPPRHFALELTFGPLASLSLAWTLESAPPGTRIEQRVEIAGPLTGLVRGMAGRVAAAMPGNLARLAALAAG